MSVRRWNTSFKREQLKKLTHTIALYESSIVADLYPQYMKGIGDGNDDMSMSDSSSSSSSSASSSSLSSPLLSSLRNMSRIEEDDELLNLVISTHNLSRKINSPFADHHVQCRKFVHIDDLSKSECIGNCRMRKDYFMILLEKLRPKMHHQLVGTWE